jgi:serine/threonine protein kinase
MDNGRPLLCDFGRSRILSERGFTTGPATTFRYTAPELLTSSDYHDMGQEDFAKVTKESDVYSLAMIFLQVCVICCPKPQANPHQVFTGKRPFYQLNDIRVVVVVGEGQRPNRKEYLRPPIKDPLWKLLGECWNQNPRMRPTIGDIHVRLTYYCSDPPCNAATITDVKG